jgi:acyl dehydratase
VLGTVTLPIEAGKVREFARAIKDDNPIYRDPEAARAAGFTAIPAPPTYTVVAAHFQEGEGGVLALGLDLARVLHGEQEWTYHRTPVVGDVLTGETKVASVTTKPGRRGGEMTFVRIETTFTDQSGQPVVTEASTVIETEAVVGGGQ